MSSSNIFIPIPQDVFPEQIPTRGGHPVIKQGISSSGSPTQTNKFYANFFLGNRNQGTWTHPYSLTWAKGGGLTCSWGMVVSHISRSQLAYGPGKPSQYFINPIGIQAMILSARELGMPYVLHITQGYLV